MKATSWAWAARATDAHRLPLILQSARPLSNEDTMKKLFTSLLLFISIAGSAQTQSQYFSATTSIDDPPYGLIAQVWNPADSGQTIYIDRLDVFGMMNAIQPATDGLIEYGFGFSHLEETQCQPAQILAYSPSGVPQAATTPVRASQQPCTPNGVKYGIQLANGQYNYTATNVFNLQTCWGLSCSYVPTQALAIPPGHGVTVYTALYKDPYAFNWHGYAAVTFRWHV